MKFLSLSALLLTVLVHQSASGQVAEVDPFLHPGPAPEYSSGPVGSYEPLYFYDDQEPWKHGYIKVMPYYGGFHSFRPYNYHHVFSQSATAQRLGMSPVMPYSQQFWHRYEAMTDLSHGRHEPVFPNVEPPDELWKSPIPTPPAPGNLDESTYSPPADSSIKPDQAMRETIEPLQYQQSAPKSVDAPRPFVPLAAPELTN